LDPKAFSFDGNDIPVSFPHHEIFRVAVFCRIEANLHEVRERSGQNFDSVSPRAASTHGGQTRVFQRHDKVARTE
jgi:hypothetical protein